jgi:hypothetical protein
VLENQIRTAQATNKPLPGLDKTSVECAWDAQRVYTATFDTPEWREGQKKNALKSVFFIAACPSRVEKGVEIPNPISTGIRRATAPEDFERYRVAKHDCISTMPTPAPNSRHSHFF